MFLDRQLRAVEATRQTLVSRAELQRRLFQLESLALRTAARRVLAEVTAGLALAERLLSLFRRR